MPSALYARRSRSLRSTSPIHVMEDGTPVNTQERVCKGECQPARPKLAALESTSAHAVFFSAAPDVQAPAMLKPTDEQFWEDEVPYRSQI